MFYQNIDVLYNSLCGITPNFYRLMVNVMKTTDLTDDFGFGMFVREIIPQWPKYLGMDRERKDEWPTYLDWRNILTYPFGCE